MARRIVNAVTRALTANWTDTGVHFHSGPTGQAYVCHDTNCVSPRRDVRRDA
jgi:hypothetical protein